MIDKSRSVSIVFSATATSSLLNADATESMEGVTIAFTASCVALAAIPAAHAIYMLRKRSNGKRSELYFDNRPSRIGKWRRIIILLLSLPVSLTFALLAATSWLSSSSILDVKSIAIRIFLDAMVALQAILLAMLLIGLDWQSMTKPSLNPIDALSILLLLAAL